MVSLKYRCGSYAYQHKGRFFNFAKNEPCEVPEDVAAELLEIKFARYDGEHLVGHENAFEQVRPSQVNAKGKASARNDAAPDAAPNEAK